MPSRDAGYRLIAVATLLAAGVLLAAGRLPVLQAQAPAALRPVLTAEALTQAFTLDGTGTWAVRDGVLALVTAGKPGGAIRRPAAIAIVNGPDLRDATLDVEVRSTAALPDVTPRRDALLIAGYQSPTRFYYVHLSAVRDDVHNGIFLVNDADRQRIDVRSDVAPLTDQAWHRLKLVRDSKTGKLDVYIDDTPTPIMTAVDTTLASGRYGVGSFDDTAEFRGISVRAQ